MTTINVFDEHGNNIKHIETSKKLSQLALCYYYIRIVDENNDKLLEFEDNIHKYQNSILYLEDLNIIQITIIMIRK